MSKEDQEPAGERAEKPKLLRLRSACGQSRGTFKTVGDQEHTDIISSYFEGLSMGKITKKQDRSAATVYAQIHSHEESIAKIGYCVECRRTKGERETEETDKRVI